MRLVFAAAGLATVVGLGAGPAHADVTGTDQAFLLTLKQAGLSYGDPEGAVNAGKAVCGMVTRGMTGVEIVKNLQDFNPDLEGPGAGQFVALSAQAYCPTALAQKSGGA
jgi:Protein of unknown function (DUF732)